MEISLHEWQLVRRPELLLIKCSYLIAMIVIFIVDANSNLNNFVIIMLIQLEKEKKILSSLSFDTLLLYNLSAAKVC